MNTPVRAAWLALLVCAVISGSWTPSSGQTVTRGPYLHQATSSGVIVRWRTDLATSSRVAYGSLQGSLTSMVDDLTSTTEHELQVTGLDPETKYFYSVGTVSTVLAGDDADHYFRTHPIAGTPRPVRVWLIGDSGTGNQNARNVRNAYLGYPGSDETNVWIMLGDNAYSTGTDAEYQAKVFDTYPQLLRNTVLWPTRGNHDQLHSGANNDYYEIFTMPTGGEAGGLASGTEAYYSFDFANVHFICLDSILSNRTPGGAMLTWLAADLASTTQQWILAYWHHPPYSKGSHDSDNLADSGGRMTDMRENALPILEAGGVDLVFTGHSHSYERSFLLDGHYGFSSTLHDSNKVDPGDGNPLGDGAYLKPSLGPAPHEGAVYAVAGSSGGLSSGSFDHPVMITSQGVLGSVVLDFNGNIMNAVFLDTSATAQDEFTIIKGMSPSGVPAPRAAPAASIRPGVPNPFSLATRFGFSLPDGGPVRVSVYDVKGRRIKELVDATLPAGDHVAAWDGRNDRGRNVSPGVYFAVLEFAGERRARKVVLLR